MSAHTHTHTTSIYSLTVNVIYANELLLLRLANGRSARNDLHSNSQLAILYIQYNTLEELTKKKEYGSYFFYFIFNIL